MIFSHVRQSIERCHCTLPNGLLLLHFLYPFVYIDKMLNSNQTHKSFLAFSLN